jgi:Fe-S-cluster-containing dehydrogenase component
MPAPANVAIDTRLCTACRACELACHFHHTGHFGTFQRSLRIEYLADEGAVTITFEDTCDRCQEEAAPLCARFCAPGAIALRSSA